MKTAIVTLCAVLMAGSAVAQGTVAAGRGGGASGGSAGSAATGSTGSGAATVDTAGSGAATVNTAGSGAAAVDSTGSGAAAVDSTGSGAAVVDSPGSDADDMDAVAGSIGTGEVGEGAVATPDGRGVPALGQGGATDSAGRATQSDAQAPVGVEGGQPAIVLPPRDGVTQAGNANLEQMTEGVGGDVEPQTRRPRQD